MDQCWSVQKLLTMVWNLRSADAPTILQTMFPVKSGSSAARSRSRKRSDSELVLLVSSRLHLDPRIRNHLPPAPNLLFDESAEFLRRAADRHDALLDELVLQRR